MCSNYINTHLIFSSILLAYNRFILSTLYNLKGLLYLFILCRSWVERMWGLTQREGRRGRWWQLTHLHTICIFIICICLEHSGLIFSRSYHVIELCSNRIPICVLLLVAFSYSYFHSGGYFKSCPSCIA